VDLQLKMPDGSKCWAKTWKRTDPWQ